MDYLIQAFSFESIDVSVFVLSLAPGEGGVLGSSASGVGLLQAPNSKTTKSTPMPIFRKNPLLPIVSPSFLLSPLIVSTPIKDNNSCQSFVRAKL
jgi:hypothetical protein